MIQREWETFLAALLFFTRIPLRLPHPLAPARFKASARYFPLIGWLVGLLAVVVAWGGQRLWPWPLAVALSMTATVLLTGALHEDGLADVCDGFGGGWTAAEILAIMKDSRSGAFGMIGVILAFGLKFLSLTALPPAWFALTVISGQSLSRLTAITLMHTHVYVRDEASSKAQAVAGQMTLRDVLIASAFGLLPLLALAWQGAQFRLAVISLAVAWLTRWGLARYFTRWIGGYTGDCLGATQQITEIVFYLTILTMIP